MKHLNFINWYTVLKKCTKKDTSKQESQAFVILDLKKKHTSDNVIEESVCHTSHMIINLTHSPRLITVLTNETRKNLTQGVKTLGS